MSLNRPVKLQIKQVENKLDKLYKGLQSVDKKYMKTFFKHTETLNRSSQSPEYFSASSQEEYFSPNSPQVKRKRCILPQTKRVPKLLPWKSFTSRKQTPEKIVIDVPLRRSTRIRRATKRPYNNYL